MGNFNCRQCGIIIVVAHQFAKTRNWVDPKELRDTSGRIYSRLDVAIPTADIICKLLSDDYAPREPKPPEEVSTRKRTFRNISRSTGVLPNTTHFQNARQEQQQLAPGQQSFIPPAGWDPTPITPFVLHGESSIIPAGNDQVEPAAEKGPPIIPKVRAPRRRSTSPESASKAVPDPIPALEGGRKVKTQYAKVRSAKLREAAIKIHGRDCCVCGFNFNEKFGEKLARGYIEVHHLNSIATGVRQTDPQTDLAPLCGNCHRMADRLASLQSSPPRSIAELKKLLLPANLQTGNASDDALPLKAIKSEKVRKPAPKKNS
jgi:hypothetical protein